VSDRPVFDNPLGLYHGGVLRLGTSVTSDETAQRLEQAIDRGVAALDAGSGAYVADVEPEPGGTVEVFCTHDVETGDLILLWRVACRERGQRIQ
jgi:hypothetical protein